MGLKHLHLVFAAVTTLIACASFRNSAANDRCARFSRCDHHD